MQEQFTLESWREILRHVHRETKSWQITGEYFHLNKATARLIAKGYRPGPRVAFKLGVTVMMPAPVCPVHGVVHTGSCPREGKRPRWVRTFEAGHAGGRWE